MRSLANRSVRRRRTSQAEVALSGDGRGHAAARDGRGYLERFGVGVLERGLPEQDELAVVQEGVEASPLGAAEA